MHRRVAALLRVSISSTEVLLSLNGAGQDR